MFNCAGIGLRTAFSSPALWTQTHFKLIGSNNSESSRRNENEGVFDDYCYGGGGAGAGTTWQSISTLGWQVFTAWVGGGYWLGS